jgi:hypothetical protein
LVLEKLYIEFRNGIIFDYFRKQKIKKRFLTFWRVTSNEWISLVSILTGTDWRMRNDSAICICTTNIWSNAWINAFIILTCLWKITFRTANALRATGRRWTSHCWKTWANWLSIRTFSALRVSTARRRLTWILVNSYVLIKTPESILSKCFDSNRLTRLIIRKSSRVNSH